MRVPWRLLGRDGSVAPSRKDGRREAPSESSRGTEWGYSTRADRAAPAASPWAKEVRKVSRGSAVPFLRRREADQARQATPRRDHIARILNGLTAPGATDGRPYASHAQRTRSHRAHGPYPASIGCLRPQPLLRRSYGAATAPGRACNIHLPPLHGDGPGWFTGHYWPGFTRRSTCDLSALRVTVLTDRLRADVGIQPTPGPYRTARCLLGAPDARRPTALLPMDLLPRYRGLQDDPPWRVFSRRLDRLRLIWRYVPAGGSLRTKWSVLTHIGYTMSSTLFEKIDNVRSLLFLSARKTTSDADLEICILFSLVRALIFMPAGVCAAHSPTAICKHREARFGVFLGISRPIPGKDFSAGIFA